MPCSTCSLEARQAERMQGWHLATCCLAWSWRACWGCCCAGCSIRCYHVAIVPPAEALLPFLLQWATFPLLQLVFQLGDWQALIQRRTGGARLHGANATETASVVAGKLIHYAMVFGAPLALHGGSAAAWGSLSYMFTQVSSAESDS